MADNDPVTWAELNKHCKEKQQHCHEMMALREDNAAQKIETERRAGMEEIKSAMKLLTQEVTTIKNMIDGRNVFVLPVRIMVLICVGMIGVGMAGEKLIGYVLKQLGMG